MTTKVFLALLIVVVVPTLCHASWSHFWSSYLTRRNGHDTHDENENIYNPWQRSVYSVVKEDVAKRDFNEIEKDRLCTLLYPNFPYICTDRSWCLGEHQICDGHVTCTDGSDERDCENDDVLYEDDDEYSDNEEYLDGDERAYYDNTGCAAMLPKYPYRCSRDDNLCLGESQICDGLSQCKEYNDEVNCDAGDYGYTETSRCKVPVSKGSNGVSDVTIQIMDAHNYFRCIHGVGPLGWDDNLARVAQRVAQQNANIGFLRHSRRGYGENLAMTQVADVYHLSGIGVAKMWYDEVKNYDFRHQGFSSSTGHFTQLVWADSTRIGCGVASKGRSIYVACEYDPPGNVYGQYNNNVYPPLV